MTEFLIVTGLSGAGKSVAINAFEDIDFYCVDNIPLSFVETFYDLIMKAKEPEVKRVALIIDVRAGKLNYLFTVLQRLKEKGAEYKILFLDAKDAVLTKRFVENRRRHPLTKKYMGSLSKAIEAERDSLRQVKAMSNYVIDTTYLSPAQLKVRISDMFLESPDLALAINCVSFGFKYGIPPEASLVFDVRCLPNPYYIDELKNLTGLDSQVKDYVFKFDETKGLVEKIRSFIEYALPLYVKEGKSQLMIAVGCTGGKHRSVAIAQFLYEYIEKLGHRVVVQHRDISK